MRANEFIKEDAAKKIRKASRESLPHAKRFDGTDQYYGYYRLGIAMAGAPDHGTPSEGPARDVPTVWPYSDADDQIANAAIKNQGAKSTTIVKKGKSQELPGTHTVSPVAQWNKK